MPKLLKLIITGFILIIVGVILLFATSHMGEVNNIAWSNNHFVVEKSTPW